MDANSMYDRFLLLYEGARLQNRTFNEREVQDYLNKGQLEVTKERFTAWRNSKGIGYGDSEVREAELGGLLTGTRSIPADYFLQGHKDNGALFSPDRDNNAITNTNGIISYPYSHFGIFVPIPDECLYILQESATTSDGGTPEILKWNVPIKNITADQYDRQIYDPYAKPYFNLVWSIDWGTYTVAEADSKIDATPNYDPSSKTYSATDAGFNMKGFVPADSKTRYDYTQDVGYDDTLDPYDSNFAGDRNDIADIAPELVISLNSDRSRYLLPGKGWHVMEYTAKYITTPPDVTVDLVTPGSQVNSLMPDFLHDEIVQKAVAIASGAIVPEQGKYQVNKQEDAEQQ